MSLTNCLKKAGSAIGAEDKSAVLEAARKFRAQGMKADAAGIEAIKQQLAAVRALMADEQNAKAPAAQPEVDAVPAAQPVAEAPDSGAPLRPVPAEDAAAEATHKDPGAPAEPATQSVVSEAIAKAAESRARKPSEMQAELLRMVDEAIPQAMHEFRTQVPRGSAARDDSAHYIRFKVPGDGTFTVMNATDALTEFRERVRKSPGFRDRASPATASSRTKDGEPFGVEKGSSGPEAAIRAMIDEKDPQAAVDYAAARGIDIEKLLKAEKTTRWLHVQNLKPSAEAVGEFEPESAAPAQPAPASEATPPAPQESAESVARRTDDAGNVAMFSRAVNTPEEQALKALAENDTLFALKRGRGATLQEVAQSIDKGLRVIEIGRDGNFTRYRLVMPNGNSAGIRVRANDGAPKPSGYYGYSSTDADPETGYAERPGDNADALGVKDDVILDVSLLTSGEGGTLAYAVASDFASSTGRVFIGDPSSLSDQALVRRTEQMLSSALKHGTTDHIAPHPRQLVGAPKKGIPPLAWDYANPLANIKAMIDVSLQTAENAGSDVFDFDPQSGQFLDSDQSPIDRAGIAALAKDAGLGRGSHAGGNTLARLAVLRSLVRSSGEEAGNADGRSDGILAALVHLTNSAPEATDRLFYSRADPVALTAAGGRGSEQSATLPLESEPYQASAAETEDVQALNDAMARYGLGQGWKNAYAPAALPDAVSGIREALQTAFGRDVRAVAPTAARFDIFNGIYIPERPGAVFVSTGAKVDFIAVAGHELWHELKRSRPDLFEWFRQTAQPYWRNTEQYRERLNALLQPGEKPFSEDKATEELEADFLGDSLSDAGFLKALADASPSKFRALLTSVMAWLQKVANKLRGLGSSEYVSDVQALRQHLKDVLVAYAEGKPLPQGPSKSAIGNSGAFDPGTDDIRYSRNTKNATFNTAFRRVSDGTATADDVNTVISRPGFGDVYEGPIARDLDSARRLQGELAELFPNGYWQEPHVSFQRGSIETRMGVIRRLDDAKLQALADLSDKYDAPIVLRGMKGVDDPVVVNRLRRYGFDTYGGMMEVGSRDVHDVGISMVRPAGGMTRLTPLFSRAAPWQSVRDAQLPAGYIVSDFIDKHGKLSWWHRTVGTMHNLAKRSPEFKRVYDSVQRFLGDVSLYATEAADLAPKLLPKMEGFRDIGKKPVSAADTKAIAAPIAEGTLSWTRDENGDPASEDDPQKAGIVWTDAELRERFNLNDAQIGLYREFRSAVDKSLTDLAISDMVRFAGKDGDAVREQVLAARSAGAAASILQQHLAALAETAGSDRAATLANTGETIGEKAAQAERLIQRGYAPLTRFGHYTLDVVAASGDRVYFGLFESEAEANKMARTLRESVPGAKVSQGTLSERAYQMFSGVSPETLELFGNLLGLESQGNDAASAAFQEYLKLAKSNRSALKRLIQRKGIAGFSEDAGRVLAGFVYSNARQTSKNLHFGSITDATQAIAETKGKGELLDAAIDLQQYITNPREEAQKIKGLLFAQFLGGSVASAMVNLTQPVAVAFPYLSQWGGARKAASRMTAALKDALKWEVADPARRTTGDAALDAAMKKAEEEGYLSPQEVHQIIAQAGGTGALRAGDGTMAGNAAASTHNAVSKFMVAWGRPFSAAEQFNRRATFIAAYRTAVEEGQSDPAAFAKQAISDTMFTYNRGNRPAWARGAIGSTLFTFKQYSISYVELMSRMAQSGPEGRKAALIGLATLALMSGLQGLPGADDLDDLIDGAMQRLGYNWNTTAAKREALASILGEDGARFLMSGLSGLPGAPIDVSGRLGLGNLIPGTGLLTKKTDYTRDALEILGPAGSLAQQFGKAAGRIAEGEVLSGIQAALPVAAANAVKAADMASMGMYRDERGRKVIDTDGVDAMWKALGFQPADVARTQRATQDVQSMVAQAKMREAEIADKWARGIFENRRSLIEEAQEDLARWNEDNETSRIRIGSKQLLDRVKSMRMSKTDRIAKTAPREIRESVRKELERTP